MTVAADYQDAEAVFHEALGDLAPVVTRTGTDLASNLPQIRATRIGGADADRITDVARMAVVVYAATIAEAKTLAEEIRQRVIAGRIKTESGGVIDRGRTETGPAEIGTDDPDQVRAMSAIYRVSLRRT
jgi:hypothetical protein